MAEKTAKRDELLASVRQSEKRIPKVKDLNAEYAALMAAKKQAFAEYRQARDEVKEYLIVQENISSLYDAEQKEKDADRRRQQEQER